MVPLAVLIAVNSSTRHAAPAGLESAIAETVAIEAAMDRPLRHGNAPVENRDSAKSTAGQRASDRFPPPLRDRIRALEAEVQASLDRWEGDYRIALVRPLSGDEKADLRGVIPETCPTSPGQLVAIDVRFRRKDGRDGFGRIIVAQYFSSRAIKQQGHPRRGYWRLVNRDPRRRDLAEELAGFFVASYRAGEPFPVTSVIPVHYLRDLAQKQGIDTDELSMRFNNTYAFACRKVRGTRSWSHHAIGALDINPLYNPMIVATKRGRREGLDMGRIFPKTLADGLIEVFPAGANGYAFSREDLDDPHVIKNRNAFIVRYLTFRGWSWGGAWRTIKDYHHFTPR